MADDLNAIRKTVENRLAELQPLKDEYDTLSAVAAVIAEQRGPRGTVQKRASS